MRQATVAQVLRVVSSSGVVFFAAAGASLGQEADVKRAIDAYHSALEAVDASKMEPLWAHDANVLLVNPANKSISVGWDAVKENWEGCDAFTEDNDPHGEHDFGADRLAEPSLLSEARAIETDTNSEN